MDIEYLKSVLYDAMKNAKTDNLPLDKLLRVAIDLLRLEKELNEETNDNVIQIEYIVNDLTRKLND